jgi:hypothetical protein
MAPPSHYLIHLYSLPFLKTKIIRLLDFKWAPKIKILVIFNFILFIYFGCVCKATNHVLIIQIFNLTFLDMHFLLSKNNLCMWNILLWKINISSMLHTSFKYEIL